MKFSLSFSNASHYIPKPTLREVVNISWWIVLALLLGFLFTDGFLFYLYGLGYATEPQAATPQTTVLHESSIVHAAGIIQNSAAEFAADPALPPGLHDPFK